MGLPAPECRWCSKFGPPAAPRKGTLGLPAPKCCLTEGVQNLVRLRRCRRALWAFRLQSADGVQNLVRLRRQWKGTLGLPVPECRWCSKFSPPAAPRKATLGPQCRWCSKFGPPAAPVERHTVPSATRVPMVFDIWSACGAEKGHVGQSAGCSKFVWTANFLNI